MNSTPDTKKAVWWGNGIFGGNEAIVHPFQPAGGKQFVRPGDGEKQPDRNADQQDRILF